MLNRVVGINWKDIDEFGEGNVSGLKRIKVTMHCKYEQRRRKVCYYYIGGKGKQVSRPRGEELEALCADGEVRVRETRSESRLVKEETRGVNLSDEVKSLES